MVTLSQKNQLVSSSPYCFVRETEARWIPVDIHLAVPGTPRWLGHGARLLSPSHSSKDAASSAKQRTTRSHSYLKGPCLNSMFFCDLKGKVTWKDSTWKWSENGWREKRSLSERLPGRCINFFGGYYVMFNLGSVHQEGWGNWSYWWFECMRAGPARFRVFELLLGRPYSCGDEEEDDEN